MRQTAQVRRTNGELAAENSGPVPGAAGSSGLELRPVHRTSDEDHKRVPRRPSATADGDAGDIYLDKYSGWYDVRDEVFSPKRHHRRRRRR